MPLLLGLSDPGLAHPCESDGAAACGRSEGIAVVAYKQALPIAIGDIVDVRDPLAIARRGKGVDTKHLGFVARERE